MGLVAFDEVVRSEVPTRSKRNHLHSLLSSLAAENPAKKSDMHRVLAAGRGRTVAKGNDHSDLGPVRADRRALFRGLKLLRHRGHDVMIFHVLDDEELDFNYSGMTKFEGMEEMGDLVL